MIPHQATILAIAASTILGLGCARSEPSPVTPPSAVPLSTGDEVTERPAEGSVVSIADDPRLRFIPAGANWVLRVDTARARGTRFEAQLHERFGLDSLSQFGPPEAMHRIDAIFAGGRGREAGAAVFTGDLAGARGAMESHLTNTVGLTPGVVGGHEALVSERLSFVFYDERTWVLWGGFDDPFATSREGSPGAAGAAGSDGVDGAGTDPGLAALSGLAERITAAGQSDPPLAEYFVANGRNELADLTLLVRASCTSCTETLTYDAVVDYQDVQQATEHGDNLTNTLRDLGEETSDLEEMGLGADGSWVRVRGTELQIHQVMTKPAVAFDDSVENLFFFTITLHPPDFSH